MGKFSLFELFLVIFAYHAMVHYDGVMRVLVPILSLVIVLLCERLQIKIRNDGETRKRIVSTSS